MTTSIIDAKAYSFALQIILLYKQLVSEKKEFVLSKQILRSGTAIGALVRESEHAQSKRDFLNKINIALKEANETKYWLQLLRDSGYISSSTFKTIYPTIDELIRILAAIVKTTKRNLLL
ncbi:four helix bundle protein [Chryseobacterium paridis]|uniref:Four helix bundle protein n=1 Tax=Chryseobacterium paridis TaxID=2800328 RepID=A0ABS1FT59_9FLAO|nr:four helix bundle protein [Chryseobacterium paridis]MBK1895611.1 four helix bundle protein [Chryseobacterium paridis]